MIQVNRSLDSKVSFLGFRGIYLLLMALWILVALVILFICLSCNVPAVIMMLILLSSTFTVALYLAICSREENILEKKVCKKRLNYYLCKR